MGEGVGADGHSSSQAIVPQAGLVSGMGANPQHAADTSDGRPNHPLRAPAQVTNHPTNLGHQPWTLLELRRQREAFFETRVTGSAESWAAVKAVCDLLRAGEVDDAQGLLDASGLTCPTGRVAGERPVSRSGVRGKKGGVYDNKGQLYEVPGWVLADPIDLVEEPEDDFLDEKSGALTEGFEASRTDAIEDEADIGEVVKIRARLSGMEKDVIVSIGMEQKVGVLVNKIKALAEVKSLKLAHMGRMLPENKKLCETPWVPGHVLNAFVFDA